MTLSNGYLMDPTAKKGEEERRREKQVGRLLFKANIVALFSLNFSVPESAHNVFGHASGRTFDHTWRETVDRPDNNTK